LFQLHILFPSFPRSSSFSSFLYLIYCIMHFGCIFFRQSFYANGLFISVVFIF
jgi:hypothetical protein